MMRRMAVAVTAVALVILGGLVLPDRGLPDQVHVLARRQLQGDDGQDAP